MATYKKIVDLGGDYAKTGYQGELDALPRRAHVERGERGSGGGRESLSTDRQVQLMYAAQLADTGQLDKGVSIAKAQLASAEDAPDNREVYLALAQIYISCQEFKAATEQLDKADALSREATTSCTSSSYAAASTIARSCTTRRRSSSARRWPSTPTMPLF